MKGLKRENLRDHMTDLELIFTMLGAASTGITRNKDAQGFLENREAARDGGTIAGKRAPATGIQIRPQGGCAHELSGR